MQSEGPTWDDLIRQRNANLDLIENLVAHGSKGELAHECVHHFYARTWGALEQLSEKAEKFRYLVSEIDREKNENGDTYYCIDVISVAPLDPRLILFDNIRMLERAKEFGAEYDGWGAMVNDGS